jgi:hypothetical protein
MTGHVAGGDSSMDTYLCQMTSAENGVETTVKSVYAGELQIRHGMGESVADALSNALGVNSAVFASLADEQEACVAVLRGRAIQLEVEGRQLHIRGLA